VLTGALVVLAATDEIQARGFRRSRGSCPNGQCYATIPAAPAKAVAMNPQAGATEVAAAPAVTAEVQAPVTPEVAAPAASASSNVTTYTVDRTSYRGAFLSRLFRRR